MNFYFDGRPITYSQAVNHIRADARQAGMDERETDAIIDRAMRHDEDGEFARDELHSICGNVEIVATL